MPLDFLKVSSAKIEINLERQSYQPGGHVHGKLTLQTENELEVSKGTIVILCLAKYQVCSHHNDGKSHLHYKWVRGTREEFSKKIIEEMVLPPRFYQMYDFDWQIPSNAIPSIDGKIIQLSWLVRVHLERPKAIDVTVETPFRVIHPIPMEDHYPFTRKKARKSYNLPKAEYPSSTLLASNQVLGETKDINLSLTLPTSYLELGDTIDGQLELHACKDCKFTEIRLELHQSEEVGEGAGNTSVTSWKVKLAGNKTMKAGEDLALPFKIEIPSSGLPSINAGSLMVKWSLEGIVARRLAPDYHVSHLLEVFSKTEA